MAGKDYKLGQLDQAIKDLRDDVRIIKKDVKSLNAWRWKVVGIVSGIAFAGHTGAELFLKYLE